MNAFEYRATVEAERAGYIGRGRPSGHGLLDGGVKLLDTRDGFSVTGSEVCAGWGIVSNGRAYLGVAQSRTYVVRLVSCPSANRAALRLVVPAQHDEKPPLSEEPAPATTHLACAASTPFGFDYRPPERAPRLADQGRFSFDDQLGQPLPDDAQTVVRMQSGQLGVDAHE